MCAAVNYAADKSRIRCASQCTEHGKARRQLLRASSDAPAMQLAESHPFADRPKPEQPTEYLTVARAFYPGRVSQYPGPAGHVVRSRSCYGEERPAGDDAVMPVETDAVPSAFASVSVTPEGATDSVLTGSTNAEHSSDDEAAERSAQTRE